MQEIIVYRSPLEAAFYHNGGPLIIVGLIILVLIFAGLHNLIEKQLTARALRQRRQHLPEMNWKTRSQIAMWLSAAITIGLGILAWFKLF